MGVCASCLGLARRDGGRNDSESNRLLDDDIYNSTYTYGALNHANQLNQPDNESLKREREALDAICQRTSDSVVDIWSLQPQPHLQPRATLRTPTSASSHETVTTTHPAPPTDQGENEPDPSTQEVAPDGTVPKHWGEVVINPRKKKRSRPGLNLSEDHDSANVFGVLNVA